jgi:protein RecA
MKRTTDKVPSLSEQIKKKVQKDIVKKEEKEYTDGDFGTVISTGSTLLDLAISSGRIRGGGVPSGIFVELFGPPGSGKTVLLCEMAGNVQRLGGSIMFKDPEARLNPQFSKLFGLEIKEGLYSMPDTVTEVFQSVNSWKPANPDAINGIFADSLAALSTNMEMEKEEGDKMGGRRAKEFSEGLRKTCRIIKRNNYLMVCSNQVRENMDAGPYGQKYISSGGMAIKHYASLSLRFSKPDKMVEKKIISGKEVKRVIGVETTIEVFKSSVWKPLRTAPVTILFDYGIDDIRQNLQFVKEYTSSSVYALQGENISKSLDTAIKYIEDNKLEDPLRNQVIDLWEHVESQFDSNRKTKIR